MPRHLAHDVHLDPGIGDPGESCVPEDMAAHVLVAELGDDVVPVVTSRRTAVETRPPRGPVNKRTVGAGGRTARRASASSRATRPAAVRRQQ